MHINESIELNIVGDSPLMNLMYRILHTLKSPTLFPDSRGDPTNLGTTCKGSFRK